MTREEYLRQNNIVPYGVSMEPQAQGPIAAPASSQSAAPANPQPEPQSSASVEPQGPNTTTNVKSSSTAPEQQPAPEVKPDFKKRRTPGKKFQKKVEQPQQQQVSEPYVAPKYTPPVNTPDTSDAVQPATANWFSSTDDEMPEDQRMIRSVFQTITGKDAIPYGQKWQWYLQHGFTGMHGGLHQELMDQVRAEQSMGGRSSTYGQELRAKEQKRRTLMDQWNKLLNEWNQGRYSGDEENVRYFYNVAEQLRKELEAEGINPNTLRPPSLNAGGFAQGFQKSLQDDRGKLDWIGGWLNDIQQNVARDPNWLNSTQAQMYFDKLSEYTILNWAQSKGAIADAEKIRAQVESMPRADRVVYDKFMNMFFNSNLTAQLLGLADAGDHDAKATLEAQYNFLNLANEGEGAYGHFDEKTGKYIPSQKSAKFAEAAMHALKNVVRNNKNIPMELTAAVTSFKNAREAFDNYVMKNANVDRQMVWNSAVGQYNIYKDMYNRKLPMLGLSWGWGHKGPTIDQDFGVYLKDWQNHQDPNWVMRNARLGNRKMPGEVEDPLAKGTGRGGSWWR